MTNIFFKDEDLNKAPAIVGFKIARYVRGSKKDCVSIFDVIEHFRSESWFSLNTFMYGLTFLYAVGLIDFEEPYLKVPNAY